MSGVTTIKQCKDPAKTKDPGMCGVNNMYNTA